MLFGIHNFYISSVCRIIILLISYKNCEFRSKFLSDFLLENVRQISFISVKENHLLCMFTTWVLTAAMALTDIMQIFLRRLRTLYPITSTVYFYCKHYTLNSIYFHKSILKVLVNKVMGSFFTYSFYLFFSIMLWSRQVRLSMSHCLICYSWGRLHGI